MNLLTNWVIAWENYNILCRLRYRTTHRRDANASYRARFTNPTRSASCSPWKTHRVANSVQLHTNTYNTFRGISLVSTQLLQTPCSFYMPSFLHSIQIFAHATQRHADHAKQIINLFDPKRLLLTRQLFSSTQQNSSPCSLSVTNQA
jgi:hypothetical protein